MRIFSLGLGLLLAGLLPSAAMAGPAADALGHCAIAHANAADRNALVRWTFMVAASNPALADLATVSPEERDRTLHVAADLFDRILLRDCRAETIAALREEGATAVQAAFEALGNTAGGDLISAASGADLNARLIAYMDRAALDQLRREAQAR